MQQLNVPFYLLFFCCVHFLSCVTRCVLTALKSTLLARRSTASLAASSTPRLSQPAPYSHSNLWAFGWVSCRSDKRLSAWKPHLLPRQQRATYICRTLSPPLAETTQRQSRCLNLALQQVHSLFWICVGFSVQDGFGFLGLAGLMKHLQILFLCSLFVRCKFQVLRPDELYQVFPHRRV